MSERPTGGKSVTAKSGADATQSFTDDRDVVCACTSLTVGDLRRQVAGRAISFDDLLQITGAGRQCTACLLDLEYLYSLPAGSAPRGEAAVTAAAPGNGRTELKQRLYQLIDRIGPPVSLSLWNTAVVIRGPGIRQWLIVANDTVLYEGEIANPT